MNLQDLRNTRIYNRYRSFAGKPICEGKYFYSLDQETWFNYKTYFHLRNILIIETWKKLTVERLEKDIDVLNTVLNTDHSISKEKLQELIDLNKTKDEILDLVLS